MNTNKITQRQYKEISNSPITLRDLISALTKRNLTIDTPIYFGMEYSLKVEEAEDYSILPLGTIATLEDFQVVEKDGLPLILIP